MRPAALLIALASALLLTVGAGAAGAATGEGSPAAGSLEALWRASGKAIGATPATSDHAPGRNRVSFIVVDQQSRLVEAPLADLWVATGLEAKPFAKTVARLETIGVPGAAAADLQHLYVATVRLPKPGRFWYLAVPRGTNVRALGNIVVRARAEAPEVGERAVPVATPTLRSTGGNLKLLTTSRRPNRALYASSVKEALAAHAPFVVTFATPLFCQTRLCGPVVDVVDAVQKRFATTSVRFIHAEVYRDNDPGKGLNPWMTRWNLPSEPWTFVVDARGRVTARFENAMSMGELVAAVKRVAR